MSKRDPTLLLGDIVEAAEKILNYTHGLSFEEWHIKENFLPG